VDPVYSVEVLANEPSVTASALPNHHLILVGPLVAMSDPISP
jgi:hypothetical protein